MFRAVPRTKGVSTTNLIGRLLCQGATADATTTANGRVRSDVDNEGVMPLHELDADVAYMKGMIQAFATTPGRDGTCVQAAVASVGVSGHVTLRNIVDQAKVMSWCKVTEEEAMAAAAASGTVLAVGSHVVYAECVSDGTYDVDRLAALHDTGRTIVVGVLGDSDARDVEGPQKALIQNVVERTLTMMACGYVSVVVSGVTRAMGRAVVEAMQHAGAHVERVPLYRCDDSSTDDDEGTEESSAGTPVDTSDGSSSDAFARVRRNADAYRKRNKAKNASHDASESSDGHGARTRDGRHVGGTDGPGADVAVAVVS